MIAYCPPQLPNYGWPSGEPLSHGQNYSFISKNPLVSHPLTPPWIQETTDVIDHHCESSKQNHGDLYMVKKLHHNACERDRRKKLNSLYFALRSLLPAADQTKKLSIPATVSQVVKYIPELQQQVKRLAQKKEELLSKMSRQDDPIHQQNETKSTLQEPNLVAVSANWLGDSEVGVQISTYKNNRTPLSSLLLNFEDEGFVLLTSSSFESNGGRIFYNLHFLVEAAFRNVDLGDLSRKIATFYEKEEVFS